MAQCGSLVRRSMSRILLNFVPLFWEQKFSTADISHISCRRVTKFGSVRVRPIDTYSPNLVNADIADTFLKRYVAITTTFGFRRNITSVVARFFKNT